MRNCRTIRVLAVGLACFSTIAACEVGAILPVAPERRIGTEIDSFSQAAATTLDQEFTRLAKIIPGFAGLYLDEDILVVRQVGEKSVNGIRTALANSPFADLLSTPRNQQRPIRIEPAIYDFATLQEWRLQFRTRAWFEGVTYLDIDESSNEIRIGIEHETLRSKTTGRLRSIGVPEGAYSIEVLPQATPQLDLTGFVRPIPGGFRTVSDGNPCTLGLNAIGGGNAGFIINSHCTKNWGGGADGTLVSQPGTTLFQIVGSETADPPLMYSYGTAPTDSICAVRGCRFSDAAFIEYDSASYSQHGIIARAKLNDTTVDTSLPNFIINMPGFAHPTGGQSVQKVGSHTGRTQGLIGATCVDVAQAGGPYLLCQYKAGYGSGGGDSGAAVFHWPDSSNSKVDVLGIHWGTHDGSAVFSSWMHVDLELGGELGGGLSIHYE